jgi:hypothetical protein
LNLNERDFHLVLKIYCSDRAGGIIYFKNWKNRAYRIEEMKGKIK